MLRNNEKDSLISRSKAFNPEIRKHRRISLQLPTEYSCKDSSITRFGHTNNICEGGAVIYIRERFEVGKDLQVRIFFNMDSDCFFIDARTVVVWRKNLEHGEKEYAYGLKFIKTSDEDLKYLKIFLKSFAGAMQDQKWVGPLQKMRNKNASR